MVRDDPCERLEYVRSNTFPGVEILAAYDSSQPWHAFHERYALCACRVADAGWIYRGREYWSTDRTSMILEPGESHRNTVVRQPSEFKVVFIPGEVLGNLAQELDLRAAPHFSTANTADPQLFAALYAYCGIVESGEAQLAQQAALMRCLRLCFRYAEGSARAGSVRRGEKAVLRAKEYIIEHAEANILLEELCAISGLSKSRLIHAFHKYTGLPPHAFQLHVRIERAQTLLRKGTPATDVASQLGFSDQSHFNRHFKAIARMTPREYLSVRV